MASSSLIFKKLRQTSCSNYLTISGFLSPRPTASFGTSRILTRSIVPYFRSPVCGGAASMVSRFINTKDFHVHVSRDESVVVNVMTRIRDLLNPRGWSFLRLKFDDEEDLPEVEVDRLLFRIRLEDTNEGVCINIIMHRVKCHNLKVFVEGNFLMCEGLRTRGKTHDFEFELPEKTYQSSDVKAKLENGVLMITIANLTREDLYNYKKGFSITSDN